MADRWTEFLAHPATIMGAGIMAGSDPRMEGLGGVGRGIMAASQAAREQQLQEAELNASRMPDYSKSPLYFRDPVTGQFRVGQLSPTGELHFPTVPEGLEPVRPITQVQSGAGTYLLPQGATGPGVPGAGYVPREVPPEQRPEFRRQQAAETAAGTVAGREEETARRRVPTAIIDANATLRRLNELRSHPGLTSATGFSSWFPTVRGTDRADFEARMDQLTGGAFLQAYQMLRGGGQITEVEGAKAEQSIMRMRGAQSEQDFLAAMDDYAEAVSDGVRKLQIDAGVEQTGVDIPWREAATSTVPAMAPAAAASPRPRSRKARRDARRDRVNQALEMYPAR